MSEQSNEAEQQPESGTAPEQKEEVTFSEEQQAVVDKIAAKGRDKTRAGQQREADLQRQLDEAQARIPKETRPNVPNAGDVYDEDFEASQVQREEAIRKAAEFDTRAQVEQENEQKAQQAVVVEQQKVFDETISEYGKRATKLGITPEDVQTAMAIVNQTGVSEEVGNFILADENGPLITKYLSENQQDIDTLNQLDAISAGIFIGSVKEKAVALGIKQTSTTPDPAETLSGAGVPPSKRGPEGATYE